MKFIATGLDEDRNPIFVSVDKDSSGQWFIQGIGVGNWAKPSQWPCSEEELRWSAFPGASEEFIQAALHAMKREAAKHE